MSLIMEEVLFKSEKPRSRHQIAEYLHKVADNLEKNQSITLRSGEDSITLDIPNIPVFEVKAEREEGDEMDSELSLEFEIEWKTGENEGEVLEIE